MVPESIWTLHVGFKCTWASKCSCVTFAKIIKMFTKSDNQKVSKCFLSSWLLFYNLTFLLWKVSAILTSLIFCYGKDTYLIINFYSPPLLVQNLFTPNFCLGFFSNTSHNNLFVPHFVYVFPQEANSINKSLSALGDVISALSMEQPHVPYRNNKLTQLMQDSLGGNAKTLMFLNISPSDCNLDETLTSLMWEASTLPEPYVQSP